MNAMLVQGVASNGWCLIHPRLGLPGACDLRDFPMSDSLHLALLKLLTWFGCGSCLAMNLYYLMSFPLTAISAQFVLRKVRQEHFPSAVGALLYALLPGHFLRGLNHLFLTEYYLIPPAILAALWVYMEPESLFRWLPNQDRLAKGFFSARGVFALVVMLFVASAGIYYAFFCAFFILVAALASWAIRGRRLALPTSLLLVGVLVAAGLANLAPSILYQWENGANNMVRRTAYSGAEVWGMKITQLLLPNPGHPLKIFAKLRARYDAGQGAWNESGFSNLGILGSVGFLTLVVRLFYRRPLTLFPMLEEALTLFNGAGIFLATVGGFGTIVALVALPSIRCYNRISFYLGFLSILMFVLLVERVFASIKCSPIGRYVYRSTLVAVLMLGAFDQFPPGCIPDYMALKSAYENDADFVHRVEKLLSPGAMVFQLPYRPFPEGYVVVRGKLYSYEHLRGYLHSCALRWSYGAMKGRAVDRWQAEIAAKPIEELVRVLRETGFEALYVDRDGYEDRAVHLEEELSRKLATKPVRSTDDRLLLYRLPAVELRTP